MIEDLLLKNVLKGENSSRKIRNRQSPNFVQRDNFLAALFPRYLASCLSDSQTLSGREHGREIMMRKHSPMRVVTHAFVASHQSDAEFDRSRLREVH
jgi:hypothetical protein